MTFAPVRGDYTLDDLVGFDFGGYIAQEKIDGKRAMLDCDTRRLTGRNSCFGLYQGILPRGCVFDGELVKDCYHAFDLLRFKGQDITGEPLLFRLKLLWTLCGDFKQVMFSHSPHALAEVVRAMDGEGIVAKLAQSPYIKGGWLRFKKLVTGDFLIESIDYVKGSAEVSKGGELCGRIFNVPDSAKAGEICEVKFMQFTETGKLRHGRYARKHQEKNP